MARKSKFAVPRISANALDKVVTWFSPALGLERMKARNALAASGGYHGGRKDRRQIRNWRPSDTTADQDILPDLPDLRSRSRDLVRNVPIATGAVATVVTNVVGTGLRPKAAVRREMLGINADAARDYQSKMEAAFDLFCGEASFSDDLNFYDMQALALRSMLESGDVGVVRRYPPQQRGNTYRTKLQLIEADRICNPHGQADTDRMVAGVQLSKARGAPEGFYVAQMARGQHYSGVSEWRFVPRYGRSGEMQFLHMMIKLRPDQVRGVPYLAPIIEALKQFGDYSEAEITAAVNAAMQVFVEQTPAPVDEDGNPILGQFTGGSEGGSETGGDTVGLENGAYITLDPGSELKVPTPGRPNPAFDAFMTAFLRTIGVALELPFEVLIKHFTASYTASRAALELAWQFFRYRREHFAQQFCQPVWSWVIAEAVFQGRLDLPGFFDDPATRAAWLSCEWIGPARISLDPAKEARADEMDVKNNFRTRESVITSRHGGRYDQVIDQRAYEVERESATNTTPGAAAAQPVLVTTENGDD
jgi:lambda family phage portal protein